MARAESQRIIVLFCHTCELPLPFENYDEFGIFIGKCAICGSEYQAKRKGRDRERFEIRPKIIK
jgi:hypothetical protein